MSRFLGPEFISTRKGSGNQNLSYVQGCHVFRVANEIFGYDGWSSEIKQRDVRYCSKSEANGKWSAGVSVVVRVTVKDKGRGDTFHEDIGHGMIENARDHMTALEKSEKEAVTDAKKRALRLFR